MPPCINKLYILDLQPENSLASGHQVYLVAWRNADAAIAAKSWGDYMDDGVLAAIDTVRQITSREQINALGFCVGGTMLATALSVLTARGEHPVTSMTLLTTMLDFTDTGVLDVFVDEAHVQMREQSIGGKHGAVPGLIHGVEFVNTFSFLRPNDLVWNYVVDNYLKGRTPVPFGLLYWNRATRPTCRARCTPGTCAIPTSRTSCASPARRASAASRSTSRASTCRPLSTARA